MAGELTNYQYYGLVGQGASQLASSLSRASTATTVGAIESMGLGASAEALELEAEMELVNADALAAQRLNELENTQARNAVVNIAMGKRAEGSASAIERANIIAAEGDVEAIERAGKSANISKRAKASSVRSAAKQASIAAKAKAKSAVFGGIADIAGVGLKMGQLRSPNPTANWNKYNGQVRA